jgi:hypothetical protein
MQKSKKACLRTILFYVIAVPQAFGQALKGAKKGLLFRKNLNIGKVSYISF